MNTSNVPSLTDLQKYDVNRRGQYEGIRQSYYDFQTYALAGQTSLSFFQVPIGQSGKTIADTNMRNAGMLPQPINFLLQSIEIVFLPGILPGTHVTTIAETEFTNDVYTVAKSGSLELFIGSKTYLEEAPLGRFPPKTRLTVEGSHAISELQAAAADSEIQVSTDYAAFIGRPYIMDPPLLLVPNQNFEISLKWPAAVALPSGVNGRIGVIMDGLVYRQSQ
jgi:hypothetical protein